MTIDTENVIRTHFLCIFLCYRKVHNATKPLFLCHLTLLFCYQHKAQFVESRGIMIGLTFKRGIHPPENKESTKNKRVEYLLPGKELVYPMIQHIGAPAKPIVKKGDYVYMGQIIGEASSFISSNIHASVSGIVKDISNKPHPNGNEVESITIENDNEYKMLQRDITIKALNCLKDDEIIERILLGGVVGLGGAGFPSHVKLSPKDRNLIDYIIVNGAECEPFLTSDHRIMLEQTEDVLNGLKTVLKLFPQAKGVIAIEDNKLEVISKMKDAVKAFENMEVNVLKTKFPQGAEKQMIYSVTKREVPSGKLPSEVGCIVHNIDTIVAIYKSVTFETPLMYRIVTVSGKNINEPKNFRVHIGTSYQEVIDGAGGLKKEEGIVISGGPMMGTTLFNLDVPIIKTSSSIVCLDQSQTCIEEEGNCIRCKKCVSVCPMGLSPFELDLHMRHGLHDEFKNSYGLDCMQCGSCSYVCPAKRQLVQSIATEKRIVMSLNRK